MEKLMHHCGNVAAERKLRTPGCKRRPAASVAVSASRLVAASVLAHGMLRTSCSRCVLAAACMACMEVFVLMVLIDVAIVCRSGDEAGGVVQAADAKLRTSCCSGDEAGGVGQAAEAKLQLHGCRSAANMSCMAWVSVLIKQ
ncbi:hypothetical protein PF005_g21180 [Phytophthora fragariae]|uniref:Uncharacterized protein n=1 Tax=Phytophthora fragariae TaxID=53985 RepID=A0A6A3WSW7_9STRA|nr:hypothetical protein PF005_g21180 [Phytophthora fragariae]KAE9193374.1 hypothetical protein PF002_g23927 [Phytophthora fragariae]